MRTNFCMAIAVGASMLTSSIASAQGLPPAVPAVLVATAFSPFGEDLSTSLTVGHTPPGWPTPLTPPSPARLIGGNAFGPFSQVVVSYPKSVDGKASLGALLQRLHFQPADTLHTAPFAGFGTTTLLEHSRSAWCSDSMVAAVFPADSVKYPHTWVLLTIREPASVRRCHGQADDDADRRGMIPLHVPPLRAPAGLRVQAMGSGGSPTSLHASATSDTTIAADSLLLHYASELRRGGWTQLGAPALTTGAGLVPFSARDPNGAIWQGVLMVISAPAQRTVNIVMQTGSSFGGGF